MIHRAKQGGNEEGKSKNCLDEVAVGKSIEIKRIGFSVQENTRSFGGFSLLGREELEPELLRKTEFIRGSMYGFLMNFENSEEFTFEKKPTFSQGVYYEEVLEEEGFSEGSSEYVIRGTVDVMTSDRERFFAILGDQANIPEIYEVFYTLGKDSVERLFQAEITLNSMLKRLQTRKFTIVSYKDEGFTVLYDCSRDLQLERFDKIHLTLKLNCEEIIAVYRSLCIPLWNVVRALPISKVLSDIFMTIRVQ